MTKLTIIETHPIQYHSPVWRHLASLINIEVLFGSDFSIAGYLDREFCSQFSWDTDLTAGYSHQFIQRMAQGGAGDYQSLTASGVASALTALQPASLMSMGYHHPFDRAGLRWSRAHSVPQLLRAETNDYASDRSVAKRFLRDFVLRRLYRRVAAFCFIGQRSKDHYQRLGVDQSRLFFSPYCVDETPFLLDDGDMARSLRAETRSRMSIPDHARVLIYSGKLSERKGVDLIPQAVTALPESLRKDLHIIFLGDGALRSHLESACSGIHSHFTGFQNQRSLSAFYYAADALILPSRRSETWGLVVNEALLHGLPCLVSDRVGCQPDLVQPGVTGAVFASNNLGSLSQALHTLLQRLPDPTLASNCRQLVRSYSVSVAAQGIAQAWHSLKTASIVTNL